LLLSDVDGLYDVGPRSGRSDERKPLSIVSEVTYHIDAMATAGGRGRGGMASKLKAARVATQSGSLVVIANGTKPDTVRRVLAGDDDGTLFLPSRRQSTKRLKSRKRWIAFASPVNGQVVVNDGAYRAVSERRSSLLLAGVTSVSGSFERGDVVSVVREGGQEFARGITNYAVAEAEPLLGKSSDEITRVAGRNHVELIHSDNLAALE
ncbi:MAG: PUA domain-containing protein, partial [Planctomycetota bacterium]